MPRRKSKPPSKLSFAVAQLRKAMGLTQPQFAELFDVKLLAVARWETTQAPGGPALVLMKKFAKKLLDDLRENQNRTQGEDDKLVELENTFYAALVNEFPSYRHFHSVGIYVGLGGVLEKILSAMESAHPKVAKQLADCAEDLQEVRRKVWLFDPLRLRMPTLEDSSSDDVAENLPPLLLEALTGTHERPEGVDAALVKDVKSHLRKRKVAKR